MFFLVSSFPCAASSLAEVAPERQRQLARLVLQDCGSCHGMTMKGGLGPALTREALEGKPSDMLEDTVYFGRAENAMPAWKELLTREEIRWLIEKLQSGGFR
ncbi:MAG: cytochrome c [Magnetococcales bacterium]|nr:cytochrome c [Magnetococcales bacterium]